MTTCRVMYSSVLKTDTVYVIIILLIAFSAFTWFAQKNRWQQIANHDAVKDAVDLRPLSVSAAKSRILPFSSL